jgi:hypothetical protein
MDTPPEIGFSVGWTITEIARAILIGMGSVTLWLLKKLGDKHVQSLDTVVAKQDLILDKMSGLTTRVAVLEARIGGSIVHMDDAN